MMRILATVSAMFGIFVHAATPQQEPLKVDTVWSGHPVGFALLTAPPWQYVGYYNAQRQMVIAARQLDQTEWIKQPLDETLGWDSHNYVTMALDPSGQLHVAGNMHVHPLNYFRTRTPFDVTTLARVPSMTGKDEQRVTYPKFFTGPQGQFLFHFRDGSSGSGNEIYNVYDLPGQQWRRLLDTPLVDGEGERNAYFNGPLSGPDGYFHLTWVWRDTFACETNHDPCYARSKDLMHWENSRGEPYALPITFASAEKVDAVPPGGGIINGNVLLGFDCQERVVVTYHKFDDKGQTQLCNARLEDGRWEVHQSSNWNYRWEFSGGGSIPFEIRLNPLQCEEGTVVQGWSHAKEGSQRWRLDPETLAPVERLKDLPNPIPAALRQVRSEFPGMQVKFAHDTGSSGTPGISYMLRWETLGPNRDKPREGPLPKASTLELVTVNSED